MLKDYKELEVWKKAYTLVRDVYKLTEKYPPEELYVFVSQIRRCALSVPSNIAEGYRRQHRKEYERFLSVALGSAAELETRILLSKDLGFISDAGLNEIYPKIEEVAKMLSGLKKSLRNSSVVKRRVVLCFLFFTLPCTLSPVPSFAGAGTTAANFLKVSVSAREAGLAGAYSALGDDSSSVFSNPAGLASVEKSEVGFGFASYLQDSKIGLVSYAGDFRGGKLGLGLSVLNVTGIERRGLSDSVGVVPETGSFDSNDFSLSLAYSQKDFFSGALDNVDAGFSLKYIRSKIDSSSAFSVAADIGALYHCTDNINLSMALMNLGTRMKYEAESDDIPLNIKAGISYKWGDYTSLLSEVSEYIHDEKFYPSLAVEHFLREGFALRTGYKFGYDTGNLGSSAGLSAGFGMKVSGVAFNYAYSPFGDLGNIHRFDFQMKF